MAVQSGVIKAELIEEIPVSNMLGEGIQWRTHDQSVWWTDILGETLYRMGWQSKKIERFAMPEALASFAFCKNDDDVIVAAFASGFALFSLKTQKISWLHRLSLLPGEGRLNDGRVDRQGRFWCGSMVANPGGMIPASGRLFCLDHKQNLTVHESNISISNGLCWSPDGLAMYFADSLPGTMYRYDFNADTCQLLNRADFSQTPKGGSPDGACVDAVGNVWSAHWGIGLVRVFNADGELVTEIETPASQPSCVTFGGKNLDLLFVTSAKEGMSETTLLNEPAAGHVFVYKTNAVGLPEMQYSGNVSSYLSRAG